MRVRLGVVLFASVFLGRAAAQSVHYVDARAVGSGSGTHWVDAFPNLAPALEAAHPGDQIWVAAGTYSPGSSRTDSFRLPDGVAIYGGLAGTEDVDSLDLRGRNFVENETILSCEIGSPGSSDNCFQVVIAPGVSRSTILDGFTITGGNADGLTMLKQDVGAGMLVVSGSPTVRWCLFHHNYAGSRGGAVHIAGGTPLFSHCRFVQNQTTVTQGSANMGGAVYVSGSTGEATSADFINCLFTGNRAGVGNGGTGGAVYVADYALATLVNCTIFHNVADTLNGGVFGSSDLANSIVWGNRDRNGTTPTAQLRGAVTASHCAVEGGWPGAGNLDTYPAFLDLLGDDAIAGTLDDDARLSAQSPCIDAGDNTRWPANVDLQDLDGAARFLGVAGPSAARIDIGAYERQQPCFIDANCDDGQWCNGLEKCVNAVCHYGTAPECSDHVDCTFDACNDDIDACIHEPIDSLCDNALQCDGAESCDLFVGCLPGIAPDCNDGVDCTIDTCEGSDDVCLHEPDHGVCDDGVFCNGVERCGKAGCVAGTPPCGASESCDEILLMCITGSEDCRSDSDCEDGNDCTDNHCDNGECLATFHTNSCNDQNPCTVGDVCAAGVCAGTIVSGCNGSPPPGPPENPPTPPPTPGDDPEETPGNDDEIPTDGEVLPDDPVNEPPAESPWPCDPPTDCPTSPSDPPAVISDLDDDGVPDEDDNCPFTPPESPVDQYGCSNDEPPPGQGVWGTPHQRRCGACGALGSLGGILMLGIPVVALVTSQFRGRRS